MQSIKCQTSTNDLCAIYFLCRASGMFMSYDIISAVHTHATRLKAHIRRTDACSVFHSLNHLPSNIQVQKGYNVGLSCSWRHRRYSTKMKFLLLISILASLSTTIYALPPSITTPRFFPFSNSTNSLSQETYCYDTGQGLKPVRGFECEIARRGLMNIPHRDEDLLWSVPRTHQFILGNWEHGNCSIEVVAWMPTAKDWFSLNEVARLAGNIITECVGRGIHLGGRDEVGLKQVFRVVVWHKDGVTGEREVG